MSLPKSEQLDALFRSILSLGDMNECGRYFEDLCTIKELQSMAQRLEIARRLRRGDSYQTTVEETGASSATISRVNRALSYGAGGYGVVLERMADAGEDK